MSKKTIENSKARCHQTPPKQFILSALSALMTACVKCMRCDPMLPCYSLQKTALEICTIQIQDVSPKIKNFLPLKNTFFSRGELLSIVVMTPGMPFGCRKSCKIIISPQIGFRKEHISPRLCQEKNKEIMRENCLPEENQNVKLSIPCLCNRDL